PFPVAVDSVLHADVRPGNGRLPESIRPATGSFMPLRVSVVALPDAVISTLSGVYDVLNSFALPGMPGARTDAAVAFHVEIVGESAGPLRLASRLPVTVQRAVTEIETTDLVIVPSVLLQAGGWAMGRYAHFVEWVRAMYDNGAV